MNQPLVDYEAYFEMKGHSLNEIGVQLLALNKYLVGYLDSDEPLPPTKDFISKVREDVKSMSFGYVPGPFYSDPPHVRRRKSLEEIKKAAAHIGMDIAAPVSARGKGKQIVDLIYSALSCFEFANVCFFMSYYLHTNHSVVKDPISGELRDKRAPNPEEILLDNLPVQRIAGCSMGAPIDAYLHGDSRDILPPLLVELDAAPSSWAEIAGRADSTIRNASEERGFWITYVQKVKEGKNRATETNKKKKVRFAEKIQRALKISKGLGDKEENMKHPYKFAREISDNWAQMGYMGKPPGQNSIVKALRKEKNNIRISSHDT